MPLIRGHHSFDEKFTQIPNDWVRDNRISLKAIGLLSQIMSHSPGWNMSIRGLALANKTGQATIKSAILELEKFGYITRSKEQKHNPNGTFADYDFYTSDPFQNTVTVKSRHGETENKEDYKNQEEQIKKNTPSEFDNLFQQFYEAYPKKEGEPAAKAALRKALKKVSFEDILKATHSYAKSVANKNPTYIRKPNNWLREEDYKIELDKKEKGTVWDTF